MRIKITLQYNGTSFFGSQIQTETPHTVMGTLEHAFRRLGIDTVAVAAGRTDRGVHATGQVVHCDLPDYWHNITKLKVVLNRQLPPTICIRTIRIVANDFHARFHAKRRRYRYILSEREPSPFEWDFVTFSEKLDVAAINRAMKTFVGTHDFTYFKKTGSETSHDRRTIYRAFAYRHRDKTVLVFEGSAFLRSQVRMMVGFLLAINSGKRTVEELERQLACKTVYFDKPAPHNGLYLARISY